MGRRGPAKTPTNIARLRGNPGKEKLNDSEPEFELSGTECPEWLTADAREEWDRIVPQLTATRIFTKADRAALAGYCSAFASFKRAEAGLAKAGDLAKNGEQVVPSPFYSIRNNSLKSLLQYCQHFGFTPSSRTGIHAPEKKAGAVVDKTRFFKERAKGKA